MKQENLINVIVDDNNIATLEFKKANIKTNAYIGKNGVTTEKEEGDLKTPLGEFPLGIIMGMHDNVKCNLPYYKINSDMYFVDDINSKYYNKLYINDNNKDWKTAEHLIDFKIQYEYLIEIKANPNNIKGKGSAIFLHCKNKDYTYGCVAIDKVNMKKIIENIDKNTKIRIIKKSTTSMCK